MGTEGWRRQISAQDPPVVSGRVDRPEQCTNLPSRGNTESHTNNGERLNMEPQGVVPHTSKGNKQHTRHLSTSPAATNLTIHQSLRQTPENTLPPHTSVIPGCQLRTHSRRACTTRARFGRWQESQRSKHLKDKYRSFQKGYAHFKKQILPSHHDLTSAALHDNDSKRDTNHCHAQQTTNITAHQINLAQSQESRKMRRMMELLSDGGTGFMPDNKKSGLSLIHI